MAWFVTSVWVAGLSAKAISISDSLRDAELWFSATVTDVSLVSLFPAFAIRRAESLMQTRANAEAYAELLPYILDTHGPGSRLSVRRDPSTSAARSRKRADGVFYTPADVAEFMAAESLSALCSTSPPKIFDPACGTGVFLRAALKELRRHHPATDVKILALSCLFGADIDASALDATAFVLLVDTISGDRQFGGSPVDFWRQFRRNLACVDTLQIDPVEKTDSPALRGHHPSPNRISISTLFPELKHGPDVILGNPPYSDIGARADLAQLATAFRSIAVRARPTAEIYLPFVEQMIRLSNQNTCAGSFVLPLSIASNVGPQFAAVRKLISKTPGQWRFAFFDREPHALFGEDVKTRNAIVLWSKSPCQSHAEVSTGPLLKWRGDSRDMMLKNLRFTSIDIDIAHGIPKIEGNCQAAALMALRARRNRLEQGVQKIQRQSLAAVFGADDKMVFVGPTAYNFINVLLAPPRSLAQRRLALSDHPLHAITCASREDALAVFAILSSRLAYWWWHAHGDGFHVSTSLISEIPFGADALTGCSGETLSRYGSDLWSNINSNPIISLNRGKSSFAFSPNGQDILRRKIDIVLAKLARLDTLLVDELQQFTAHVVAAKPRSLAHTDISNKEGM